MNRQSVLRFEDVTGEPGGVRILAGAQGVVPEGQVTVLAGPSGAGKTSLLRFCNQLDVPDAGRVVYRDRDVAGLEPLELRGRSATRATLTGSTAVQTWPPS